MRYKARLGDVSLFETEKAGIESTPDHSGYLIAHRDIKAGERVDIALWAGHADSPRSFRGRLSDTKNGARLQTPIDLFGNPLTPPVKR